MIFQICFKNSRNPAILDVCLYCPLGWVSLDRSRNTRCFQQTASLTFLLRICLPIFSNEEGKKLFLYQAKYSQCFQMWAELAFKYAERKHIRGGLGVCRAQRLINEMVCGALLYQAKSQEPQQFLSLLSWMQRNFPLAEASHPSSSAALEGLPSWFWKISVFWRGFYRCSRTKNIGCKISLLLMQAH